MPKQNQFMMHRERVTSLSKVDCIDEEYKSNNTKSSILHSLSKPGIANEAPNLTKINHFITPTKVVNLGSFADGPTHSRDNSFSRCAFFEEKNSKAELVKVRDIQDKMMKLISHVGQMDSINLFRKLYFEEYRECTKDAKEYEFDSFNENWTFLHEASKLGNTDISRFLLLEMKQNPNIVSDDHWTPLQLACDIGHYKIV